VTWNLPKPALSYGHAQTWSWWLRGAANHFSGFTATRSGASRKEELFPRILERNPDGPTIIDDTVPGYYHFEVSESQLVGSDRPVLLAEHHDR
jgi:hypothetical protein